MQWGEIRVTYPDQWLLIEALEARTTPDNRRRLEKIAIIEPCADGKIAFASNRRYHQLYPEREFYFVHTSRKELDIHEQQWVGIRFSNAA